MQLILNQKFYDDAYSAAMLVSGTKNLYLGFKKLFNTVVLIILFFISLPLFVLFAGLANTILYWLRYQLNNIERDRIENISASEYKSFRSNTDQLNDTLNTFSNLTKEIKESKPSFPFKKSCQLILDIEEICKSKYKENLEFLSQINSDLKEYKEFESIDEDELWKNRPSTYEYLV